MNNILSEKEYQKYILERLAENGYKITPSTQYDRLYAVDRVELFSFLESTQPEEMTKLRKIYKEEKEPLK